MKFHFAAAYVWSFLLPLAVSELRMTVMLNNGVLPTPEGYNCNANDSMLIQNAIENEDDDNEDDDVEYDEEDDRRMLKTKTKCKDECSHVASGSCHATGCKGFRRQLMENDQRTHRLSGNRKLDDDDAVCSLGIETLNKELDNLLPKLSASCRSVVQTNRVVTCFDDVRYARIDGFNLWNADTDTVVATSIQNSTTFCSTNSNLNLEAVANACVEEVEMRLSGPISAFREDKAPHTIFGVQYNNRNNLNGRRLPIGTYTLSTELDGSFTPKSKVTFSVKKC